MSTTEPCGLNSDASKDKQTLAKKRWKLLIDVLTKGRNTVDETVSVRRFASFGLLRTACIDNDGACNDGDRNRRHTWYTYTCLAYPEYSADVRHLDDTIEVKDVLGFNNTGNVCVWPSEEILTYYCLKDKHRFRDKTVCELGGGMTCLAGLAISLCCGPTEVLLTDGNEASVKNIDVTLARNKTGFNGTAVTARVLRWNEDISSGDLQGRFDFVVCADCLFFDEYRQDLVNVLWQLLKEKGEAVIFAPSRGDTFDQFKALAGERFQVREVETYDEKVSALHKENVAKGLEVYDPNLHYPRMLQLLKGERLVSL